MCPKPYVTSNRGPAMSKIILCQDIHSLPWEMTHGHILVLYDDVLHFPSAEIEMVDRYIKSQIKKYHCIKFIMIQCLHF